MNFKEQIVEKSKEAYHIYVPHLSIDTVIFGFNESELKVLLLKMNYNKQWFLPGGYVGKSESLNDAAQRILQDRAGVENIFLEEFGVFGELNRNESFFEEFDDDLWHKQRFISIGYYALVDYKNVNPKEDALSEVCEWVDLSQLSDILLTMDHRMIIEKALLALREKMAYKPIGYNLLPEKFTLPELQKLYEVILGKELNRGNFYRKIKNTGILQKLDERKKGGAHKSPDLYSFHIENYNMLLKEGLSSW